MNKKAYSTIDSSARRSARMGIKMKKAVAILLLGIIAIGVSACGDNGSHETTGAVIESQQAEQSENSETADQQETQMQTSAERTLVLYFSRMGNMDKDTDLDAITSASINLENGDYVGNVELMADHIAEKVNADDVMLIKTLEPYSSDYDETVEKGEGQNQNNIRPELDVDIDNLDEYHTIFLGYPIWNYTIPVAVASFLEQYDLSGKEIILFGSSGASSVEATIETVSEYQPNAEVTGGLTIRHNEILDSDRNSTIDDWLNEMGYK